MFQFQYRNKNQNFRISNFVVQFIKKIKKKNRNGTLGTWIMLDKLEELTLQLYHQGFSRVSNTLVSLYLGLSLLLV